MKKIIFQDGDRQQEIVLKDSVSIDELYYRTYRFQRSKGWFDFDWNKVNTLENERLTELIPDLARFTYLGKQYVYELNWHSHVYTLELGANSITMADKIIQKFYDVVKECEFQAGVDCFGAQEALRKAQSELKYTENQLAALTPSAETYAYQVETRAAREAEVAAHKATLAAMRNPNYVPGVSAGSDRIKFAIYKPGQTRSTCNLTMAQCDKGIPDKVKKQLFNAIEKDPGFTFTLKMFLVFDYLDAIPGASRE